MTPTCIFIDMLLDIICVDVMLTFVALPLKMIGSTASRYEFWGINRFEIIEWRLHWSCEYTVRYDLNWCNVNFLWHCPFKWLAPQWASMSFRKKPHWNIYMVAFAASRYEFLEINGLWLIKWWLNAWIKYLVWFALILHRLLSYCPRNDPIHSE